MKIRRLLAPLVAAAVLWAPVSRAAPGAVGAPVSAVAIASAVAPIYRPAGDGRMTDADNPTPQSMTSSESYVTTLLPTAQKGCIQIKWPGYQGPIGAGEKQGAGPITVDADVRVEPTLAVGTAWATTDANQIILPVTFGSSQSATGIAPVNGLLTSNPVCYPFRAGERITILTHGASASPIVYPGNTYTNTTLNEVTKDGYFVGNLLSATVTTAATSLDYTLTNSYGAYAPFRPGSMVLGFSGYTGTITDDGNGNIPSTTLTATASGGASNTISGTVSYTTGEIKLTLSVAMGPNQITVSGQGLWGTTFDDVGASLVGVTGFYKWTGHPSFGPSEVDAIPLPGVADTSTVAWIYGDSLTRGFGSTYSDIAWLQQVLFPAHGVIKTSQTGELAQACSTMSTSYRKLTNAQGLRIDRVFTDLGINDLGGNTAATVEANISGCLANIARVVPGGYNSIYLIDLQPRVLSASSNTPYSSAFATLRNTINAWEYTYAAQMGFHMIDQNVCIEGNPGTAGAGAGDDTMNSTMFPLTKEGLHWTTAGYSAIASCMASNPAFTY